MESGILLGFIVSKDGIWVHPLKVEAIFQFPSSKTIRELQILQGKATFFRRFITDYDEISKALSISGNNMHCSYGMNKLNALLMQ